MTILRVDLSLLEAAGSCLCSADAFCAPASGYGYALSEHPSVPVATRVRRWSRLPFSSNLHAITVIRAGLQRRRAGTSMPSPGLVNLNALRKRPGWSAASALAPGGRIARAISRRCRVFDIPGVDLIKMPLTGEVGVACHCP